MMIPRIDRCLKVTETVPAVILTVARGGAAITPSTLVDLCASAAPIASMLIFFAPWPTLDQVAKDKNVGSLPLLPYSSMIANCLLWGTYGFLKKEPKIWATNGIGLVFGLFYFLRFIKFAAPKSPSYPGSIGQHISACVAVFASAVVVTTFLPAGDAANILGNMAVLFCIAMFGSPLSSLKTVIKTKSASSIPLPFTVATCLNCVFWSVVGIFQMKDAKVYVPNVLGLSFGLAQVALKLIFGDGRSQLERTDALM